MPRTDLKAEKQMADSQGSSYSGSSTPTRQDNSERLCLLVLQDVLKGTPEKAPVSERRTKLLIICLQTIKDTGFVGWFLIYWSYEGSKSSIPTYVHAREWRSGLRAGKYSLLNALSQQLSSFLSWKH